MYTPIANMASLNGVAFGAGLCFACACDMRIAADVDTNILGFSLRRNTGGSSRFSQDDSMGRRGPDSIEDPDAGRLAQRRRKEFRASGIAGDGCED